MIQEKETTIEENLTQVNPHIKHKEEHFKRVPRTLSDTIARICVRAIAKSFDIIFKKRYGNRAIVLETVAAVPGIVGGLFQHLKSLRLIRDDNGWIKALLDEAENERIHLLVYSEIAKPTPFERVLILIGQAVIIFLYSILYLLSPRTAHRAVGYLEEEAIHSYETYLKLIHEGVHENIPAGTLAKYYWDLADDARLTDVVEATIRDEMLHRDVNHTFADSVHASHFR
jgi:ubiquinol oxidase